MTIYPLKHYINKKNNNVYKVLHLALDVTDNTYTDMVVYTETGYNNNQTFTRELTEFTLKFKEAENYNEL